MKFCIDIALRGSTKHLEFLNSGWLLILAAGTDLAHVLICFKYLKKKQCYMPDTFSQ